MKPELRAAIEDSYRIRLQNIAPAPRGQVATETYVLQDETGRQYFCKIMDRPDFIRIILPTLPVLREMKDKGVSRIAAPVPAKDGLSIEAEGALIVLFDFIPAIQGYEYDLHFFGRLLGEIHALTPQLVTQLPPRGFSSFREEFLTQEIPRLMTLQTGDAALQSLQALLLKYADDTRACIDAFFHLKKICSEKPCTFVNTHGDVVGNVLVKSPQDVYLIDWDEMERGPAERDLWALGDKPEFMAGYTAARPGFTPDPDALKHAWLKNYLEGIPIYLGPIMDDRNDMELRLKQVQKLEAKRLNGWMKPKVREIIADGK